MLTTPLTIDIRTLAIVAVGAVALAALVPVFLRILAPAEQAVQTWSVAAALGVTATLLATQRGVVWDVLAFAAADGLGLAAFGLFVQGCRQLTGARARRRVPLALGLALALASLPLVYPAMNLHLRTLLLIAALFAWSVVGAWVMARSGYTAGRLVALVFALLAGAGALRVAMALQAGQAEPLFAPTVGRLIDFGGAVTLAALGTVAALLLVAEVALEQLRALAYRDALTGLANRSALEDSASRELARARRTRTPLGVLMIDIDHFKAVNDRLGHAAGDAVLRAVADALRVALRREDELGRFGGEEFVALLPGAAEPELIVVGERLRRAVAEVEVLARGRRVRVTVSVGGACVAPHEPSWLGAVERADRNLYGAKAAGRDAVVVRAEVPLPASPRSEPSPPSPPPRRISASREPFARDRGADGGASNQPPS